MSFVCRYNEKKDKHWAKKMSELVGHILGELIEREGTTLLADPFRLKSMLEELCPDEHRAARLMLIGLGREIPQQLIQNQESPEATLRALSLKLQQENHLAQRFARWIVETWAAVLGIIPPPLEPRNIFAEAAEEYRNALRATWATGQLNANLEAQLNILSQQLLLEDKDRERIRKEVHEEYQRKRRGQQMANNPDIWIPPIENSLGMSFIRVEPGRFMMGSPPYEGERESNETLHEVTLTQAYYLQTTPVTQAQWHEVMGQNPSDFKGAELPVENVSWNDIVTQFLPRLNQRGEGNYRLPTEAEWEYATRAGSTQAYGQRDDASHLDSHAWYNNNSNFQTQPVKQKKPNPWGFYDMHGNIWEWCADWYGEYGNEAERDPQGPPSGQGRVMRGGSWFCSAGECRAATRGYMPPETRIRLIGFRLVREDEALIAEGDET